MFALLLLLLAATPAAARDRLTIGFLGLQNDSRYDDNRVYARIELRPRGDPLDGAKMAVEDMKIVSDARGFDVNLDPRKGGDDAELLAAATDMVAKGQRYIVLDLPDERVQALATAMEGQPVTLLNATAPAMALRTACHANLLHTSASDRMLADALVQYLRQQDWTRILMLVGKETRDADIASTFRAAAERMRLTIVDQRSFDLSTAPENRDKNNIRLLTGSRPDYDVVYLADSDGEFGRYVPYQTVLPRPVVGTTGLTPLEWHWSLERYGAPQVNSRFELIAGQRRMAWQDWSVWAATRAVITAAAKSRDQSPEGILAYLKSDRFRLDGSKGVSQNFRPWNGQMRMPILLATHNAIIDIAPLDGFMHQTNTLDTLGTDKLEFACD
jgi:ABC transporter substrate binding protein (PQQ-dependent alcohol dehydrogenase system)